MIYRPSIQILGRSLLAGILLVGLAIGLYEGFAWVKHEWGIVLPPLVIIAFSIFTMVLAANIFFSLVFKRIWSSRQNGLSSIVSPVKRGADEYGEIVIKRTQTFADQHRMYTVLIDNKPMGEVAANGMCRLLVTVGGHSLSVKIDWCHSRPMQLDVQKNATLIFDVINTASLSKMMPPWWYACFSPRSYLSLIQTNPSN